MVCLFVVGSGVVFFSLLVKLNLTRSVLTSSKGGIVSISSVDTAEADTGFRKGGGGVQVTVKY